MAAVCLAPSLGTPTAVPVLQRQPAVTPTPKGFKPFIDPAGRFSLVYPEKWKPVAGARDVLIAIVTSDFKTVVLVQQQMSDPLPEISQRLMGLEANGIRARQPDATGITPSVANFRQMTMVVDYSRPGINGVEQVRQYGIYESTLVRITCIAPEKDFKKNEKFFEEIARSLRISPQPATGGSVER
jgi:hypothetical protein